MKKVLLSALMACFCLVSAAQQNWWQDASAPSDADRDMLPAKFRSVQINPNLIASELLNAPHENDQDVRTSPHLIEIPLPDGSAEVFRYVYSPSVEEKLAQQMPGLRTYAGQGVNDPSMVIRFSLTELGFHAWIDWMGSTIYMDPYTLFDNENCMVYYRKDYVSANESSFVCHQTEGDSGTLLDLEGKSGTTTGSEKTVLSMGTFPPRMTPKDNAQAAQSKSMALGDRKDYVIAIAATGEYTSDFGGTVSGALAGLATSLNRVNGIYNRDFNVRLFLSGSNADIVYVNAGTDPYSSSANWPNENQANIDTEIGNSNYDIGHLVSGSGSGGFAPGDVCNNSNKARAYTARNTPMGDPFDVDYLAHEIGHQFSASHTFNATSGQRTASTAVEPGAGSSIMAYAGVIGSQSYVFNSDDVFHAVNITQVDNYITTGTGSTCETITNVVNSPPVATSTNFGVSFLPRSTPFFMSASWDDPNNDPMTFTIDQTNTGPASANQNDLDFPSGNQPTFRPREDVPQSIRYFPEYGDITAGNSDWDEKLASYSRDLSFTMTARDNYSVGGNTGSVNKSYSVVGSAGPFVLTSQSSNGLSYDIGSPISVTWQVNNTNVAPLNATNVQLWTVVDGPSGATDFHFIGNFPNTGSASVVLDEAHLGENRRIWIQPTNGVYYAISNGTFDVEDPTDIALTAILTPESNQCGTQVQPSVTLFNAGPNTITSATIDYFNDGALVLTQPWSGSLSSGASVNTTPSAFYSFFTSEGSHAITATVRNPNGISTEENLSNNSASKTYGVGDNTLFVNVTTDRYGGETTWEITEDGSGDIVASGGAYASQSSAGEYPQPAELACLSMGCYTLTVFDSFGDGMCCSNGNGFINVTNTLGDILATTPEENWGSMVEVAFCIEEGCLDPEACDYNEDATVSTGCSYDCIGCTDSSAYNWEADNTIDDGSCDYTCDEISVRFDLVTDCFPGETGWAIAGEGDELFFEVPAGTYTEGGEGYSTQLCLTEGCYDFYIFDSFGDGLAGADEGGCLNNGSFIMEDEDGQVLFEMDEANFGSTGLFTFCITKGCFEAGACNYDPTVNANDPEACDYSCVGCTDPTAFNWDPTATIDDGNCDFSCTETPVEVVFTTDCFQENQWLLIDNFSGDTLQWVQSDQLIPETTFNTNVCLADGCYNLQVLDGFGDGMTCNPIGAFTVLGPNGEVLVTGDPNFDAQSDNNFCVTTGCTDSDACNFNPSANVDSGDCDFVSCTGCIDPLADNFDSTATQDDGSCAYTCVGTAVTFNLTTDCFEGETSWQVQDEDGNVVVDYPAGYLENETDYSFEFCIPAGECYSLLVFDGFGDGLAGLASGCTQDGSFNLIVNGEEAFALDDPNFGSLFEGDFCIEIVGGCPGDVNNDGQVNTSDLVTLLGALGCTSSCGGADITGDGIVNTSDIVLFLSNYGAICD